MSAILHILNGDATRESFETREIPGEAFVWREVLCEGPSVAELGTTAFWELRRRFFTSFFEVEAGRYDAQTVEEFCRLEKQIAHCEELVLWFEYDLFCQINLMALLSWLHRHKHLQCRLSLICTGYYPGFERMLGLGEIPPAHYEELFEDRQYLTSNDLFFANIFWKTYCSTEHQDLTSLAESSPPAFQYLEDAVVAHCRRFPSYTNGLNEIQQSMLEYLADYPLPANQLVRKLLERPDFYGFGDLQYFRYLEDLSPLYHRGEALRINELGQRILDREANFIFHAHQIYRFGGADNTLYRWIPEDDRLAIVETL